MSGEQRSWDTTASPAWFRRFSRGSAWRLHGQLQMHRYNEPVELTRPARTSSPARILKCACKEKLWKDPHQSRCRAHPEGNQMPATCHVAVGREHGFCMPVEIPGDLPGLPGLLVVLINFSAAGAGRCYAAIVAAGLHRRRDVSRLSSSSCFTLDPSRDGGSDIGQIVANA